uniref:Uncharacterized protein n=1 Tax=Anguilla anguilla TaxID=7936 RepID=A0A0E9TZ94_ANGAN
MEQTNKRKMSGLIWYRPTTPAPG